MRQAIEIVLLTCVAFFIMFQVAVYQFPMCFYERLDWFHATQAWVKRHWLLLGLVAAVAVGVALW